MCIQRLWANTHFKFNVNFVFMLNLLSRSPCIRFMHSFIFEIKLSFFSIQRPFEMIRAISFVIYHLNEIIKCSYYVNHTEPNGPVITYIALMMTECVYKRALFSCHSIFIAPVLFFLLFSSESISRPFAIGLTEIAFIANDDIIISITFCCDFAILSRPIQLQHLLR